MVRDRFGIPLNIGDEVIIPGGDEMLCGQVTEFGGSYAVVETMDRYNLGSYEHVHRTDIINKSFIVRMLADHYPEHLM